MINYFDFNQKQWDRIQPDWMAWWEHKLDRPLIVLEAIDYGAYDPTYFTQFIPRFSIETPIDEILDYFEERFKATYCYAGAFPKWFPQFGAGVMAAFLGSQVDYNSNSDTVWFHSIEDVTSISDIKIDFDTDNIWWQRVKAITQRAVERWGKHLIIGHTDIGGNLDILASLRNTEDLLLEFYDAKDEVLLRIEKITKMLLQVYEELQSIIAPLNRGTAGWPPLWFPGNGYMLQSDISYMISPKMFKEFVLPDLVACCEELDYGFYHMDGIGQIKHLDMLLSIERLRGIQWIPGYGQPDPEEWPDLLRRIRDAGKLCQIYVTREGANKLIRELGGKGFVLCIREDEPLKLREAEEFLSQLQL